MSVSLAHPELPTCDDCHKWVYDPKTWVIVKRGGRELERQKGVPTPCHTCPKGPEPFKKELNEKNKQAVNYYRQCMVDTTGLLPRDLKVIENNAAIKTIEDEIARLTLKAMSLGAAIRG